MASNLSGNQQADRLQSCVQSYNQLVKNEVSYDIRLFDGYEIADCSLKFPVEACRHLTGIHKFRLDNIGSTSRDFFAIALSGGVTFEDACRSNFLINDDIPPEGIGMQTPQAWKKEKEKEAWYIGALTKSQFVGRLSALENIHDTIGKAISGLQESSPDIELKIYKWNRNSDSKSRPHGSTITADFLFEFEDKSKTEKPFTAFFIRQTENGSYVGESILTSDYTFSEDLPTEGSKRVPEVTLLSFLEKGSYPNPVNFSLPETKIHECEEKDRQSKQQTKQNEEENKKEKKVNNYVHDIHKARKNYIEILWDKKCSNEKTFSKKEERKIKDYDMKRNSLNNENKYPDDILQRIKEKLLAEQKKIEERYYSASSTTPEENFKVQKASDFLEEEIGIIDSILSRRHDKGQGQQNINGNGNSKPTAPPDAGHGTGIHAFWNGLQEGLKTCLQTVTHRLSETKDFVVARLTNVSAYIRNLSHKTNISPFPEIQKRTAFAMTAPFPLFGENGIFCPMVSLQGAESGYAPAITRVQPQISGKEETPEHHPPEHSPTMSLSQEQEQNMQEEHSAIAETEQDFSEH